MVKVTMTLRRVGGEKSTRCWFRFFKQIHGGVCKREDMIPQHIASSVPKYSGLANAEAQPFIVGEMPLECILVAHLLTAPAPTMLAEQTRQLVCRAPTQLYSSVCDQLVLATKWTSPSRG